MSEPNSGSDLASIRTRAVRTADGWRLTGSKIWTTIAQHAHYMIALARSSGQPEDRQKGLSQFLIDLSLPGVRIRPIRDAAGDEHFNEVFFDDVLLPADALIGEEGAGWAQVNAELAFERSGPERFLSSVVVLDAWIAWLRTDPGLGESGAVLLGRLIASLAALRGMSLAVTALLAAEEDPVQGAALVKDLGTEYEQYLPVAIADAIAAVPDRSPPPELLRALQYTSVMAPSFSLRGGTREIIRGMIARGMGLR
jgi:alkylation response protein AidB-like acyl-CoA dehydrogenase